VDQCWAVLAPSRLPGGRAINGGIRPFGFSRDRTRVVHAEAAIIREAAARVLAGESLGAIAGDLTARGVATVRGGPWSRTSIRQLLLRPRVAGLRQHRGAVVGPAAWPAILDGETYEGLRATLTGPRRRPPGLTNARKYLLSGIASCGVCRSPLKVHHGGPSAPLAYACPRRGCGKVRRSLPHLDELVTGLVLDRLAGERSRQADPVRANVLAGLAGPDLAQAWAALPLSRRRAVICVLAEAVVVLPVVRRGRGFDPSRVEVRWR
jgi:Recombinase